MNVLLSYDGGEEGNHDNSNNIYSNWSSVVYQCASYLLGFWRSLGNSSSHSGKKGEQQPIFKPRKLGTILVAVLILLASSMLIFQAGYLESLQTNTLTKIGSIVCATVFMIRAIGDFNYLGFFKKIKHSQFARYDTWIYSPLCLFLGLTYIILLF